MIITNNLLDVKQYDELIERLNNLSSDSKQQWGKMTISQMLAHCNTAMEVATGQTELPRSFLGKILGKIIKKTWISGDKPFSQNSPTDKSLIITNDHDFDIEKEKLKNVITLFHNETSKSTTNRIHPFFGELTIT